MGQKHDTGGEGGPVEVRRSPDGSRVAVLLEVGRPWETPVLEWVAVYVHCGQVTLEIVAEEDVTRWDELGSREQFGG
jgi:hypothetical protein